MSIQHHDEATLQVIKQQVRLAIAEDLGTSNPNAAYHEDVTARLLETGKKIKATILCREKAVLCGQEWVNQTFQAISPTATISWQCHDGDQIFPDQLICEITGNADEILTAERTALNFLQTLSSTASITAEYVKIISHTICKILDTRKTIPGLRLAQKYAVSCGGGVNHRIGLYDMVLIKENHIIAAGSIKNAVTSAKEKYPGLKIEVEVETLDELNQAIDCDVDRILLDNMDITTLNQAVEINAKRIDLEASGNITRENIADVAGTGVDYISTGAITKNVRAIDFSLRIKA